MRKNALLRLPPYIEVKKSRRAKRLALRLDASARVFNLVVPKGVSLRKAHNFAEEHKLWMKERLQQLAPPIYFEHGEKIPVFGRRRTINVYYDRDLKNTDILLNYNNILVLTGKTDPAPQIEKFLREQVREHITALAHEKAELIRKKISKIYIRDTKSRWGSCAEDGTLSFSWRLILAPYEALDYVVAHEVAHLKHLDHSKKFWELCEELSEDYEAGKAWMRLHGHELLRYLS